MNTIDFILWAIGIIISILLAIATKKSVKKIRSQKQKTSNNSISMQAGRDINTNDKQ